MDTTTKQRAYSVSHAADSLDISERTVWRLIAADKIRTIRIGPSRRLIPADEIDRIASEGIATAEVV